MFFKSIILFLEKNLMQTIIIIFSANFSSPQLSNHILVQERMKNAHHDMIDSAVSISKYETRNLKNLLPQVRIIKLKNL